MAVAFPPHTSPAKRPDKKTPPQSRFRGGVFCLVFFSPHPPSRSMAVAFPQHTSLAKRLDKNTPLECDSRGVFFVLGIFYPNPLSPLFNPQNSRAEIGSGSLLG